MYLIEVNLAVAHKATNSSIDEPAVLNRCDNLGVAPHAVRYVARLKVAKCSHCDMRLAACDRRHIGNRLNADSIKLISGHIACVHNANCLAKWCRVDNVLIRAESQCHVRSVTEENSRVYCSAHVTDEGSGVNKGISIKCTVSINRNT